MRLYDLTANTTSEYSHNDPVMAFAQHHASTHSLNTKFAVDPNGIADIVKPNIRKGRFGYHFGSASIPFASIKH